MLRSTTSLRNDFGDRVVTRAADQIATDVGGIQQSRQLYTRRGGRAVAERGRRRNADRQSVGRRRAAAHFLRAQDLMTAPILSIDAQVAAMKVTWPQFVARRIDRHTQSARWVGAVKPQFASYSLEIRYELGSFPEVRVLAPELVRLPGNVEGQLPHVYPPAEDPTLCLFDPREQEWTAAMTIASTTVPWALDWLACYELWLMTGGGRHLQLPPVVETEVTR